jgi:hypothetical protein
MMFQMKANPTNGTADARQQEFERILALEPFTGLKAILEGVSSDRSGLCDAVNETKSYEELLTKLGYRMNLVRQIHVQDAFTRLGRAGGIRKVLPYYDIPTQSSFPTLVNFDSTVTATPESAQFFNNLLVTLRQQLVA